MQGGLLHPSPRNKISIAKAQETALQTPRHAAAGLGTTQRPLSCYPGGRVPSAATQLRVPLRPCGAVPRPRGGRRCFGPGGGAVAPRSGRARSRAEPSGTEWGRTEPSRAERSRAGRTALPLPEVGANVAANNLGARVGEVINNNGALFSDEPRCS